MAHEQYMRQVDLLVRTLPFIARQILAFHADGPPNACSLASFSYSGRPFPE